MKADPLFPTFDFADIDRVQFCPLSEFFLAQFRLFAELTDGFAQNFEMFRFAQHWDSAKQEGRESNTPNKGLFFSLPLHNKVLKQESVIMEKF